MLQDPSLLDYNEQKYFSEFLDDILQGPSKVPTATTVTDKKRGRPRKDKKTLLSDSEKRMNHVVSEQRRRKLIKDGFEQLVEMIPGLNDVNGTSKSTVLFKTAEYIKELEQRVEMLTRELNMKNGGGMAMNFNNVNHYSVPPSFLVHNRVSEL